MASESGHTAAADLQRKIEDDLADADVERAVKRLLDFARENDDPALRKEATLLSGQYNQIKAYGRTISRGEKYEEKLNLLRSSVFDVAARLSSSGLTTPAEVPIDKPLSYEELRTHIQQLAEKVRPGEPGTSQADQPVFHGQGIRKRYLASARSFQLGDISLELRQGEITGVVGANSSGKSTLLRVVAGELAADSGELRYPTVGSGAPKWSVIRRVIAYVPQQPLAWPGTMREHLHFCAAEAGLYGPKNEQEVDLVIQRLGLQVFQEDHWRQLSAGMRMRYELARSLVARPRLMVLDEPLAPLDPLAQLVFLQDLRDFANSTQRPLAIILSSQHIWEVETIADRMVLLANGRAIYAGPLKNLAERLKVNCFEFHASVADPSLKAIMAKVKAQSVQCWGSRFIVEVPREVTSRVFLEVLVEANVEIKSFVDWSGSAHSLIRKEAGDVSVTPS
jgi:ABC-2 type transport system ATP-binding protein